MKKRIIYFCLIILACIGAYMLGFYLFKPNEVVLDDVSLKEVVKEEKKTMAIMLGDKNGVYTESDSNFWPSNKKYIFNSERSGCIDMKGNPVDGVLSYNNELMAASLTTNKTVSCYLYFDLETVAPQEFVFYLGGITNPDYINTREISTYITYQDDDISHYCITKDTSSNSCVWNEVTDNESQVIETNYTLDDNDTLHTVYAYLRDEAGNVSPSVVDTINLDRTNPSGTVVINNGDAYSTSRTVTLTLTSSDSAYICISENTTCTNYIDYTQSYSYTFSSDGDKTIYVTYKDNAENVSEQVSDSITVDTSAPSNGSVSINSNAEYSTSRTVTLTLSSSGASTMCISESTSCTNYVDYATSKSYTFSSDGTKTIYVTYKDEAGNVSTRVNDSIIVDTAAPSGGSISINGGNAYTNSTSVTLTLSSSGASQMCISNTTSCTNYVTYAQSYSWTLNNSTNGTKTVYVTYKDAAGNTSSRISDTITLDTVAPSGGSISINNNATYSTSRTVTLTLSANGASQMCISESTSCSSYVAYAASKSYTFSSDGTKTIYVTYKDAAGNTSSRVNDSIIVDTVVPTVTVTNNESTLTISSNEAGTYCINTSSTATDISSCTFSGNISANSAITTNEFTEEGTYYVHVQDSAGNIGISNAQEIVLVKTFGEYLLQNALSGKTAYSGLYRYTGTSANNYVSVGGVLYRVIGVTDGSTTNTSLGLSANQVKVMKAESIGTKEWYTHYTVDVRWNVSGYTVSPLYTTLQSSTVLGKSSVIPSAWKSKISSVYWYVGDVSSSQYSTNATTVYGREDNAKTQSTSKVGLMYLSDYYYAYNDGGTTNCYSSACSSWMTLGSVEWTMSRHVYNSAVGAYGAWAVDYDGSVDSWALNATYAVRPVFYLDSSVLYTGEGDGSSGSPYEIA